MLHYVHQLVRTSRCKSVRLRLEGWVLVENIENAIKIIDSMHWNYNFNILTFMYYVDKYVYHANQLALARPGLKLMR